MTRQRLTWTGNMLKMTAVGVTDVGRRRTHNEDDFFVDPTYGIAVVADGMGGHACGEIASKTVVQLMQKFYAPMPTDTSVYTPMTPTIKGDADIVMMDMVLRWVNHAVFEKANENNNTRGMGSTVVACKLTQTGMVVIGHLGDSRCYRFRNNKFQQLTDDHSLVVELSKMYGKSISELIAEGFQTNVITRACGLKSEAHPTVISVEAELGDVFLLCSDGVTGELHNEIIAGILKATLPNVSNSAKQIVHAAVTAGGKDNVTAIVCHIE